MCSRPNQYLNHSRESETHSQTSIPWHPSLFQRHDEEPNTLSTHLKHGDASPGLITQVDAPTASLFPQKKIEVVPDLVAGFCSRLPVVFPDPTCRIPQMIIHLCRQPHLASMGRSNLISLVSECCNYTTFLDSSVPTWRQPLETSFHPCRQPQRLVPTLFFWW